jgi:hypothetical protein
VDPKTIEKSDHAIRKCHDIQKIPPATLFVTKTVPVVVTQHPLPLLCHEP